MNSVYMIPHKAKPNDVEVAANVCRKVADILRLHSIPEDHEDSLLVDFTPEQIGNYYLLLVAISHQTSPIDEKPLEGIVSGHHLVGWDYLTAKLEAAVHENPAILTVTYWDGINAEDIRHLFNDIEFGDRLNDLAGRARLIQDIGHIMLSNSWQSAEDIYAASDQYIEHAGNGMLELLAQFQAYRDPVRKKSYFYLALMRNASLWRYKDVDNLGAPVDYHEIRGHLRIGTVHILDSSLRRKLIEGHEVTAKEDVDIRRAVHNALMLISEMSGLRNPSRVHYLFWNVFRSCCTRQNPHCNGCPTDCKLPARYVPLTMCLEGKRQCPFAGVCNSVCVEPKLNEQRTKTDYY
jgi:hypothetical protein